MMPRINQQVSSKLQSYLLGKYECMEIIYILRMGIFFKGNVVIFFLFLFLVIFSMCKISLMFSPLLSI